MRSLRLNYHLSKVAVHSSKERFSPCTCTDGCPRPDHNNTITLSLSLFPILCCHSLEFYSAGAIGSLAVQTETSMQNKYG